jgi:hypothetical protein
MTSQWTEAGVIVPAHDRIFVLEGRKETEYKYVKSHTHFSGIQ